MDRPERRSDCSKCAALCCIAFASDKSPGFNASKKAGQPCPNLDACGLCSIYETREEQGFAGCNAFECFGAGQHVVQNLYHGHDWRDDPQILDPMLATFRVHHKACELLYLVDYARQQTQKLTHLETITDAENELLEITMRREQAEDITKITRVERDLRELFRQFKRK